MKRAFRTFSFPLAACLAAACAGMASAQAQAPASETPLVLKAAHLFDSATGTLRANGVVVVEGEKILASGTNVAIPAGARVIDLGDATLIAEYIDAHTHVTMEFNPNYYRGQYEDLMRFP